VALGEAVEGPVPDGRLEGVLESVVEGVVPLLWSEGVLEAVGAPIGEGLVGEAVGEAVGEVVGEAVVGEPMVGEVLGVPVLEATAAPKEGVLEGEAGSAGALLEGVPVGVGDKVPAAVRGGVGVTERVGVEVGTGGVQESARMRWLPKSPMKMVPLGPTVMPTGALKREPVPTPSTNEAVAFPATVVTAPRGETMRMRLLPQSATRRLPLAAMERWYGSWNEAKVPVPSVHAATPLPTKVDTVPLGAISLMRWLPKSPT